MRPGRTTLTGTRRLVRRGPAHQRSDMLCSRRLLCCVFLLALTCKPVCVAWQKRSAVTRPVCCAVKGQRTPALFLWQLAPPAGARRSPCVSCALGGARGSIAAGHTRHGGHSPRPALCSALSRGVSLRAGSSPPEGPAGLRALSRSCVLRAGSSPPEGPAGFGAGADFHFYQASDGQWLFLGALEARAPSPPRAGACGAARRGRPAAARVRAWACTSGPLGRQ